VCWCWIEQHYNGEREVSACEVDVAGDGFFGDIPFLSKLANEGETWVGG
jgi:hypothetical protein